MWPTEELAEDDVVGPLRRTRSKEEGICNALVLLASS